MRLKLLFPRNLLIAAAIFGLACASRLSGASINWSAPVTIAGDTDVVTNATLKYAYNLSGTTATVTNNGVRVTFTGKTSTTALGSDVGISGVSGGNFTGFGASSGFFTNLSGAYQTVLKGGDWGGTAPLTLTLSNLTVGHAYLAQVWVNESRSNYITRSETVTSPGGNSVILDYDNSTNPATSGGVGQFAVGNFIADAAVQPFKLTGNDSSQFNAIQVRDLGSESTSSGVWTNIASGQLWGVAANWSNSIVASGSAGTADFGQLDILGDVTVNLEAPRVIHNLIFGDVNPVSAGGWTLANNGMAGNVLTLAGATPTVTVNSLGAGKGATISAVLTGVGGLTKAGAGRLTLAAQNTFAGTTTISAGTLALASRVALYGSTNLALAGGTLDVTGISFALTGGQVLSGSGTVNGSVSAAPGTGIAPGSAAVGGTLTFNNGLDLSWGSICYFDITVSPGVNADQIVVGGDLTLGGTIHVSSRNGSSGLSTSTDYILFAVNGVTDGQMPALVWDGTRPGNYASFSLALSGNNLVLHYNPSTIPAAPTNLVAVLATNGISLAWSPVSVATSYNVKRSAFNGGPYFTLASNVIATNFVDTNALAGTTDYYSVSAVNSSGESLNSKTAFALPGNFLKTKGCDMCDHAGSGKVVPLRGANLGGWLFFEGWMCPNYFGSNGNPLEQDVAANLTSRFGLVTNDLLMDAWRSNWITTNDLDALAALGMNLARFHFTYDSFQELPADPDVASTNVLWKPDAVAFNSMDWLMTECAKRQIYVVLDYDYPEGSPDTAGPYQDRFLYIWQRVAAHYAGNPTVLGYDLWNESGASGAPALFDLAYQAIRMIDPDHPVIMEQCWWGPNNDLSLITQAVTNYNWTNIMGEQHYVAGTTISNIVMAMRSAPTGTPIYPVYCGEFMLNGTNVGLPDIASYAGSGALFTSWTLKSVNQQDWSLFNMLNNGPGYNNNYVPDLLNDSAGAIAGKWANWKTPPVSQISFYQPSLVRLAGPVCVNHSFAVAANGSLAFTAAMLLTNNTDLNPSNHLAITSFPLGRTSHGLISTNNGGYLYQPDSGFTGVDNFTYQAVDLRLDLVAANVGTVTLNVGVPPAPTSLVAGNVAGAVNLTWISSTGATGYNVKRALVTGGPYTVIASALASPNYSDTNVYSCTTYFYVVSAIAAGYESPNSAEVWGQPTGSIPSQFQTADIGSVGLTGSASCCSGEFTVAGAGADIWGSADAFRFVYAPLSGDGSIVARVTSLTGTDPWAKAGVMMRENLSAGARNVCQLISYANGATLQWRATASGGSANLTQPAMAPYWVMLTRTNNTFTGYISADGNYWTPVGSTNISMANTIVAGLAVTAHTTAALNSAEFDNVSASFVSNSPPTVSWVTPSSGATWIQSPVIPLIAQVNDANGVVTNVAFFNGPSLLGSGTSSAGNLYTLSWNNVPPGAYTLFAVATDNLGATNLPVSVTFSVQPLTLTIVSGGATNGPISLSFAGQNGQSYVVETSTNLLNWLPFATNSPAHGMLTVTDANTGMSQRFYRVRQ